MTLNISREIVTNVADIARRAGAAVMEVYNSDFAVENKDDNSPVTEADKRAEEVIVKAIKEELTDDFPFVAEEAVSEGRIPEVGNQPFWLIDPLDGTKQFVNRNGEFTVNIALIDGGRPELGVIYAPATDDLYWGSRNGVMHSAQSRVPSQLQCRTASISGVTAVVSRSHRTPETDAYLKKYKVLEEVTSGSSIKFCLVASGKADLYPRMGRTMEWDTAAGHAILRFAGGSVQRVEGGELPYGKPGFSNPHFVAMGKVG